MAAILPCLLLRSDQAQPRFMHQRRRLQSLIRRFTSHFACRQLSQFSVDQRQQFISCLGIALLDRIQNVRDVAHLPSLLAVESGATTVLASRMINRAAIWSFHCGLPGLASAVSAILVPLLNVA